MSNFANAYKARLRAFPIRPIEAELEPEEVQEPMAVEAEVEAPAPQSPDIAAIIKKHRFFNSKHGAK